MLSRLFGAALFEPTLLRQRAVPNPGKPMPPYPEWFQKNHSCDGRLLAPLLFAASCRLNLHFHFFLQCALAPCQCRTPSCTLFAPDSDSHAQRKRTRTTSDIADQAKSASPIADRPGKLSTAGVNCQARFFSNKHCRIRPAAPDSGAQPSFLLERLDGGGADIQVVQEFMFLVSAIHYGGLTLPNETTYGRTMKAPGAALFNGLLSYIRLPHNPQRDERFLAKIRPN